MKPRISAILLIYVIFAVCNIHSVEARFHRSYEKELACRREVKKPIEQRIEESGLVFTGQVLKIYKSSDRQDHRALVIIKRVVKGDQLLENFKVPVDGFGSKTICHSKVLPGDNRIFFANSLSGLKLRLAWSPIKANAKNLQKISNPSEESSYRNRLEIDEKPCEKMNCPFGATCVVDKQTNRPSCQCLNDCKTDLFAPVCGTDNVTYSSECKLQVASCTQRKRIYVKYLRECNLKDPCARNVCPHGSKCQPSVDGRSFECICPGKCIVSGADMELRVCGSDGIDYPNSCELRRNACLSMKDITVKYKGKCDPCDDVSCLHPQRCLLDELRKPVCDCNFTCHTIHRPVCASDGRTYENECQMNTYACREGQRLRVLHEGVCLEKFCQNLNCSQYQTCHIDTDRQASCMCHPQCPSIMRPVCGSDGKQYDSECDLQRQSCLRNLNVSIKYGGPCQPDADSKCASRACDFGEICYIHKITGQARCRCPSTCTEEYDPVCGTDGISYTNECKLRRESCEKRRKIEVDFKGLCGGCENKICNFYSICETDGRGRSQCVCPESCINVDDPVCGSDGKTYRNDCELRVSSCKQQKHVEVGSKGTCQECRHVFCNNGAKCEKGKCVCQDCPVANTEEWVCASDGVSYRSQCEMVRAGCLIGEELSVKSIGQCKENAEFNSINLEAVNNSTEEELINTDLCSTIRCRFGSICDASNTSAECVCKFECQVGENRTANRFVCGSDYVLYGNECLMKEAACNKQIDLVSVDLELCKRPLTNQECQKSTYGCCADGKTASLGPWFAGCPDTCNCNRLGSTSTLCDPITKQCSCKPGVGGLKCDRCEPGFWGLHRISEGNSGCTPCGCDRFGSVRDDCEQTTGRCVCKNGAIGMKCGICAEGYQLTPSGCTKIQEWDNDRYKSCAEVNCHFGAICRDLDIGPTCSCDFACDDSEPTKVCASDNNTYGSECQVRLWACRYQINITVIKRGKCGQLFSVDIDQNSIETENTTIVSNITAINSEPSHSIDLDSSQADLPHLQSEPDTFSKWSQSPSFEGDSYMILRHISGKLSLSIEMDFIASQPDGILLYNGFSYDGKGDFVAIILRNGFPQFLYNLGSGTVVITSLKPIVLGQRSRLLARRHLKDGSLIVDGITEAKGSSQGTMQTLDLADFLYLGSMPTLNDRIKRNLGVDTGFRGCILNLKVNDKNFNLKYRKFGEVFKANHIKNCDLLRCANTNDLMCPSAKKCDSVNCQESRIDYQNDQPTSKTNFVPAFNGSSFIKLQNPNHLSHATFFEIWFFSRASNGLFFYCGPTDKSEADHIWLAMMDGHLYFSYNLGSGPAIIRSPYKVTLNQWHILKVTRHQRRGSILLDSNPPVKGESRGSLKDLNLKSDFFLGGLEESVFDKVFTKSIRGFDGAIQWFSINGPPCYKDSGESVCLNDAVCEAKLNNFTCICKDGYAGLRCQRWSKVAQHFNSVQFDGKSYVKFRHPRIQPPKLRKPEIEIAFRTLHENGLLLWKGQKVTIYDGYVSLTIENGHLVLLIHYPGEKRPRILRSYKTVSDGDWHVANIKWAKKFASLSLDNSLPVTSRSKSNKPKRLNRFGVFWIGGHQNLSLSGPSSSHLAFNGCLKYVKIDDKIVDWKSTAQDYDRFSVIDPCCQVCPEMPEPVCASDGKTYSSRCMMLITACKAKKRLFVKHEGPC